jgi:general secretion pathway protein L
MDTAVIRLNPTAVADGVDFVRVGANGARTEQGRLQPALLPRVGRLVAVWPAEEHALFAVQLPAVAAARLRGALAGALEERLLDDLAGQHLAAGPREVDGTLKLACACTLDPLRDALRRLADAAREADAVVPECALIEPGEAWLLALDAQRVRLLWRGADGEAGWLHADAAGDAPPLPAAHLRCDPQLHALASRWWACNAEDGDAAELLARAASSAWNLRQFDLAPQAAVQRGLLAMREALRTPAWRRVVRLALVLLLVQVVGLETVALQLHARRHRLEAELRSAASHALPGQPAILDAGLQMHRALDEARARAGAPGSGSLETLLGAAAQVLPPTREIEKLVYQPGQLQLEVGTSAAQAAVPRCEALGLRCDAEGATLHLEVEP